MPTALGALQLHSAALSNSGSWQVQHRDLHSLQRSFDEAFIKGLEEGVVGALRFHNSCANTISLSFWLRKVAATVACWRLKDLRLNNFCIHFLSAFLQIFVLNLKICVFFCEKTCLAFQKCNASKIYWGNKRHVLLLEKKSMLKLGERT